MANKIDEYNKQLSNLNGNPNADGNAQPQGGGSNADNYYELARQQEYGTLYDKEVQLENAKQNALKYTQNQSPRERNGAAQGTLPILDKNENRGIIYIYTIYRNRAQGGRP